MAITQLRCRGVKEAVDNASANGHDCAPVTFYLGKSATGWIWPLGISCLTPGIH